MFDAIQASRIQFRRLRDDEEALKYYGSGEEYKKHFRLRDSAFFEERIFAMATYHWDIHFLAIALDKLWKSYEMLSGALLVKKPELKLVHRAYADLLEASKSLRDYKEHLDKEIAAGERMLGGVVEGMAAIYDNKGGGKQFDISVRQHQKVEDFFSGVLDACEKVAERESIGQSPS